MLSAESSEFSTSSLTVVYRHFPGCKNTELRDAASSDVNLSEL
jgi:hypothetical protein